MNNWMNNSAAWLLPRFHFDETTPPSAPPGGGASPPAGGGTAPPVSAPASGGVTPVSPIPDSPPETVGAPSPGSDPFEGLEDDLDAIDLGEQPTGDEPGVQPAPPAPPVAPPVQPAAPPAGPQAAPPVQPAAQPAGNVPAPARSSLDVAIEGFKTNQKELSDWASQNLFALTKEEQEALDSDAVAMIPKLMGRVYTQAIQATSNLIKNFVPEMVNSGVSSQQRASARATEALNEFYTANPHLNAQAHGASVDKWARAFRAANPSASRKDAIAFVGRAVSAEHNLAPGPNGATRRPPPFAPARPGGRAPPAPQGTDPYAGMEDEYD